MRAGLANILARGVVALVSSASKMQNLQLRLLAGELKDSVEHLEPYGFTACPLVGAEVLAGFLDGDRSHGVVIVVADRRFRLKGLRPGEVALYTDEGDHFHFKRGRVVDLKTGTLNIQASDSVNFDTPLFTVKGRVESDGDQVAAGVSQAHHVHSSIEPGSGKSGPPGGGGT